MTPKFKTRETAKSAYSNYLQKAEECFHAALMSMEYAEWNAAAINAIHSCISASDAMCAYYLGRRHSGEDHNDVATLFKSIRNDDGINTNAGRIIKILRTKNMAEYEDRLVRKSEAESIFKDCERFLEYVKKQLPK